MTYWSIRNSYGGVKMNPEQFPAILSNIRADLSGMII